jgi:hypothetical protein
MLSLRIDKLLSELSYKFAHIKQLNGTLLWANPNLELLFPLMGPIRKKKKDRKKWQNQLKSEPEFPLLLGRPDTHGIFFFATDAPGKEARTLVSGKPLQPVIILMGKATNLP